MNPALAKAKQMLNILKALPSAIWCKQKELNVFIFKAAACPILEYSKTMWTPIVSNTMSRNCRPFGTQLCTLLLAAHKTQTLSHLQNEIKVLPMDTHLKLGHDLNAYSDLTRNMKATIF